MKTSDYLNVAELLKKAKVSKMEDKDKMKLIKAVRFIMKITKEYEELVNDTKERLKDERFDEMLSRAESFNEKRKDNKDSLTNEELKELNELNSYFNGYNNEISNVLKDEYEKEITADYERLSDDAFSKFIASNDFTVEEMCNLENVLV